MAAPSIVILWRGIQKAGCAPKTLSSFNNALEVMTGAILPFGANTVIPYERFSIEEGRAYLQKGYTPRQGANIHVQGSDHAKGDVLLSVGTKLTPASVALIAGLGNREALVSQLPSVAIVSTGDELISPGRACKKWQIWRSNTYGIYAELVRLGYTDSHMKSFHVRDNKEDMITTLSSLLQTFRILILSGGVSMGKYDFIPTALEELGVTKIFHKVKQKPGKPLYFGIGKEGQNIFGLPGNPVSSLVCMRRYITSLPRGGLP